MNKMTISLLILCAVLLGMTLQSKADGRSFAGVIPFSVPSGRLGFFNQADGRVYVYDNNYSDCVYIGQIEDLGKAITTVLAKHEAPTADPIPARTR